MAATIPAIIFFICFYSVIELRFTSERVAMTAICFTTLPPVLRPAYRRRSASVDCSAHLFDL